MNYDDRQSVSIQRLSSECTNKVGNPLLILPSQWGGLPLQLCKGKVRATQGPSHVEHPMLYLCVAGQCRRWYQLNGKNVELVMTPGMIDLLGEDYQREGARWEGAPGYTVGVHLSPEIVNRLGGEEINFKLETKHEVQDKKLEWLVQELVSEAQGGAQCGMLYAQSLSCALIARLSSNYGRNKIPGDSMSGLSVRDRCRIIDFINENISENLCLATLAKEVDLSPHHFSRCFSICFGQTPHRYVLQRRIEQATKMLKATLLPLDEIALNLGFSSHAHFSQVYRKLTGMTPVSVRTRYGKRRLSR